MPEPYLRLPFPRETSLAELYHENTKFHPYMQEAEPQPEADYGPAEPMAFGDARALPDPMAAVPEAGLAAAIVHRRSRRGLTGEAVALDRLSTLLALTYGVTGRNEADGSPARAAPSAGGRYPLELFVVARRVDGLAPGVWHYRPDLHAVEPVRMGDLDADLARAFFGQASVTQAAFVVLVGAVMRRTLAKYQERGYRLVLLDAGHAMQNLMLASTAMGLSGVGLGGFLDDALGEMCGLNGVDENVVYAVAVGRPESS